MLEEYSQMLTEFMSNGVQEKMQQGSQIFADSWNWVNTNQNYILCVSAGVIIGLIVHKLRKKQ